MWVRGLKLIRMNGIESSERSHPMWVRGLKQMRRKNFSLVLRRTPCGCVD